MVALMDPKKVDTLQYCEFLELFSGVARTSRLASMCGYHSKAFDVRYSKSMDLLKPAGFMRLVRMQLKPLCAQIGPGPDHVRGTWHGGFAGHGVQ